MNVSDTRHPDAAAEASPSRRVLFVTYYFPPSGGPGVQRSLKFTKYLPQFGWQPTILTVEPEHASYPDLDPDLGDEVPPSVRVERTYAWDPYALYARVLQKQKQDVVSVGFLGEAKMNLRQRTARWVRANIFLPDARVGWVPFAVKRGNELLRRERFDAVMTTSPPHSTHLVGAALAQRHRIPWLTDFRDPWTEIDYYADLPMTAPARAIDSLMERFVLRRASAATVISDVMKHQLQRTVPLDIDVIENGFDPADFDVPSRDAASEDPDGRFTLAHVGSLNGARNPHALWEAVAALNPHETMPKFRVALIGNVEPAVLSDAERFGLIDRVDLMPYVPHADAVRRMQSSTMLLLSINRVKGAEGIVTGKLYEYVATRRPVIGIGPVTGDAARILHESGAGRMFDFDDAAALAAHLRKSYDEWAAGSALSGATEAAAMHYSRREQAARLAEKLESLIQASDGEGGTGAGGQGTGDGGQGTGDRGQGTGDGGPGTRDGGQGTGAGRQETDPP